MKHSRQRQGREFFERRSWALKRQENKIKAQIEAIKVWETENRASNVKADGFSRPISGQPPQASPPEDQGGDPLRGRRGLHQLRKDLAHTGPHRVQQAEAEEPGAVCNLVPSRSQLRRHFTSFPPVVRHPGRDRARVPAALDRPGVPPGGHGRLHLGHPHLTGGLLLSHAGGRGSGGPHRARQGRQPPGHGGEKRREKTFEQVLKHSSSSDRVSATTCWRPWRAWASRGPPWTT